MSRLKLKQPPGGRQGGAGRLERAASVVGGSIRRTVGKTRATPEAVSKKRHSYKPLPKQFRRDGFSYQQIGREGCAALYQQRWSGCTDPSVCYEVIRIRRREAFEIGGRFVEPAEVYPNSEAWGADGFTFTDRNKAWAKFSEISLEEPTRRGREVRED